MEFQGVSLSSPIYDKITELIRVSYPNSCVLYIDEIINERLYTRFEHRKQEIEKLRGKENVHVIQLFHGTKYDCINGIALNGFMTAYNTTSAYGKGTYFSKEASYSRHYTDRDDGDISYMFVCDVIVGRITTVNGSKNINTLLYDNSVNNTDKPTIYVTPYDDGAYPRYLVAFHKNAK